MLVQYKAEVCTPPAGCSSHDPSSAEYVVYHATSHAQGPNGLGLSYDCCSPPHHTSSYVPSTPPTSDNEWSSLSQSASPHMATVTSNSHEWDMNPSRQPVPTPMPAPLQNGQWTSASYDNHSSVTAWNPPVEYTPSVYWPHYELSDPSTSSHMQQYSFPTSLGIPPQGPPPTDTYTSNVYSTTSTQHVAQSPFQPNLGNGMHSPEFRHVQSATGSSQPVSPSVSNASSPLALAVGMDYSTTNTSMRDAENLHEPSASGSLGRIRKRRERPVSHVPLLMCPNDGCKWSSKGFDRAYNLKEHMKTHDTKRIKSHRCTEEGCEAKPFAREHDLKRHFSSKHERSMDFICTQCKRKFNRKDTLRRHCDYKCKHRDTVYGSLGNGLRGRRHTPVINQYE